MVPSATEVFHPVTNVSERRERTSVDASGVPKVVVTLSNWQFRLLWGSTLCARIVCCAFLISNGVLYLFMITYDMAYWAAFIMASPEPVFTFAGAIFILLGSAHCYQALKMLGLSLWQRQLVFDTTASQRPAFGDRLADKIKAKVRLGEDNLPLDTWRDRALLSCSDTLRLLIGRGGVFGIDSGYFDVRFVVREAIEIVSQTVQVYGSSVLIGKPWINNMYVVIIALNCWSTPVVKRLAHHSPPLERVACLVTDAVLDSGTSMLMPVIIFMPYYYAFLPLAYSFDSFKLYDSVWFVNLLNDNHQIFAQGWLDLLLKFVPHLSIFICLSSVKTLVRPTVDGHYNISSINTEAEGIREAKYAANPPPHKRRSLGTAVRLQKIARRRLHGHFAHAVHLLFFLWGLGVVILHLTALHLSTSESDHGCKQPLRPWFATKYSCSVYEYNCYRHGTTTMPQGALSFLAPVPLASLLITHCSALTVQRDIQNFPNLLGMEIFNSSIVAWPREAGITTATNPMITYVFMIRSNMSALPEGLLYDLPTSLIDVEISVSNLTTLPDDLDQHWSQIQSFYFEHSHLRTVPEVLMRMVIGDFSLIGNDIEALPRIENNRTSFYYLALSSNPLRSLPDVFGDQTQMSFASVENTLVTTIPTWMTSAHRVYAYGTPFCSALSHDEIQRDHGEDALITCVRREPRINGRYPLSVIDPQRPL
ncbi:TPA: hypothetical protein N0F65_009722 [Lagenidium giganteum]|uniref:Leucine-rich repeat domain, L domain-like n=1 Tax=Lagenidium giganteum TaxID=4803 RepID=A0AAV2YJE3_9STRA|nr:TPA: hypothetical protein N0F65_009722 [Lagenidium giganteum]